MEGLPPDVLLLIALMLDASDLRNFGIMCRRMHISAKEAFSTLWSRKCACAIISTLGRVTTAELFRDGGRVILYEQICAADGQTLSSDQISILPDAVNTLRQHWTHMPCEENLLPSQIMIAYRNNIVTYHFVHKGSITCNRGKINSIFIPYNTTTGFVNGKVIVYYPTLLCDSYTLYVFQYRNGVRDGEQKTMTLMWYRGHALCEKDRVCYYPYTRRRFNKAEGWRLVECVRTDTYCRGKRVGDTQVDTIELP